MNSPPHRANILDPNATHVGIGSWRTAAGQSWTGGGAPYTNVYVATEVFVRLPVSTPVAQTPSAVTGLGATSGAAKLNVSWNPAAANGSAVDMYGVYVYGSSGYTGIGVGACGTCTSAIVSGLTNGTMYYAVVYAHNGVGWSAAAATGWVTPGTPAAPAWATASGGPGKATASWGPSAAIAGVGATDAYAVLAYENGAWTGMYQVSCGTCTTATVTGLTAGHTYVMSVLAHNAVGWSVATPAAAVTVS